MRILFHMLPSRGHVYAALPLARSLALRGHQVVWSAIPDQRAIVEKFGFQCLPVHEAIFPLGSLAEFEQLHSDQHDWAFLEREARLADDYFSGRMEQWVSRIAPALIVADTAAFSPLQYVAHRLDLPCLQFSATLSQRMSELPPLSSLLGPETPRLQREAAKRQTSFMHRFVNGRSTAMILSAKTDRYAARFGYPNDQISFDTVMSPALRSMPEIVACAAAFDFPRTGDSNDTFYASLPVDTEREEEIAPTLQAFYDPSRPLIYASLGSHVASYPHARAFFEATVETLRRRPEWHGVVVTGHGSDFDSIFSDLPNNLFRVSCAPQLWLLKRASVFATHASLASVREAITLHVPMAAVPQRDDQLGNAARLTFHRIGNVLAPDLVTPGGLSSLIARTLDNATVIRQRLRQMNDAWRCEADEARGITLTLGMLPISVETPEMVDPDPLPLEQGWSFVDSSSPFAQDDGIAIAPNSDLTISANLIDALANATGPILLRFSTAPTSSEPLRKSYQRMGRVNARGALYAYATWCASAALERVSSASGREAQFRDYLKASGELLARAATAEERANLFRECFGHASRFWHHGFGATAYAIFPEAHKAALWARLETLSSIARAEVTDAGTLDGAKAFAEIYQRSVARFDCELERLLGGLLRDTT